MERLTGLFDGGCERPPAQDCRIALAGVVSDSLIIETARAFVNHPGRLGWLMHCCGMTSGDAFSPDAYSAACDAMMTDDCYRLSTVISMKDCPLATLLLAIDTGLYWNAYGVSDEPLFLKSYFTPSNNNNDDTNAKPPPQNKLTIVLARCLTSWSCHEVWSVVYSRAAVSSGQCACIEQKHTDIDYLVNEVRERGCGMLREGDARLLAHVVSTKRPAFGTLEQVLAILEAVASMSSWRLQLCVMYIWTACHGSEQWTRHPVFASAVKAISVVQLVKLPECICERAVQKSMHDDAEIWLRSAVERYYDKVKDVRCRLFMQRPGGLCMDVERFKRVMCNMGDGLPIWTPGSALNEAPLHVRERIHMHRRYLLDPIMEQDAAFTACGNIVVYQDVLVMDEWEETRKCAVQQQDVIGRSKRTVGADGVQTRSTVVRIPNICTKNVQKLYNKRVDLFWAFCHALELWGIMLKRGPLLMLKRAVERMREDEWQLCCENGDGQGLLVEQQPRSLVLE